MNILEKIESLNLDELEEYGLVVIPEKFETEEEAEKEGFYWFDELDRWIKIEEI